ncbi:MAG: PD-(D/E)XK nuclease family protein [Gammaproteobacteria bacterium]
MTGKTNPKNASTLKNNAPFAAEVESAARALIKRGGDVLCLCADDDAAAMLRRAVAKMTISPVPLPVISWQRLSAAADSLPDNMPPQKIAEVSALLPLSGGRWQMNAAIYAHLSATQQESGGMRLADSLAQLFEEMGECGVYDNSATAALAADGVYDNFLYEAKLLDDIRNALAKKGGGKRLMTIAAALDKPLLFVCTNARPPTPMQQKFIDTAANAEVFYGELPAEQKHLRAALSADGASEQFDIGIRKCDYYCALSVADAARAALAAVHTCLAKQKTSNNKKTAIVVYDRLLARRLRALAEADNILIADRAGWRAATLSCGAALGAAAAAVAREFDINDAELLLQPPFWQSLTDERHDAMMEEWRIMMEKAKTLPGSWAEVSALASEGGVLRPAAHHFAIGARGKMTAGEWLAFLRDAFAPLLEGYDEDSAAMEMFARLQTAGGDNHFRAGEFCAWLGLFLRGSHISGDDIDSPIVFIPPNSAAAEFDDVILLGANDKTLPAPPDGIFGERLRAAMGLPSRRELMARQRDDFCRLIARRQSITAIWHDEDGDNPQDPAQSAQSPFLALYAKEVIRCGGKVKMLPPPADMSQTFAADITPPQRAAAIVRYIPKTIGVKEAETLMRCPYRFFTRAILRLRDKRAEAELSPVLEGEILHSALQLWAAGDGDMDDMKGWRAALSAAMAKKHRPRMMISASYWLANSGALLRWQAERKAQGWQIAACEEKVQTFLPLESSLADGITLRGRIDRRDTCGEKTALIDYKRRKNPKNPASGEDPQLPLYAFLSGCPDAELIICQPVSKGQAGMKPMTANVRRIIARLRTIAKQAANGAPLPANGAADICKTCESRRLCRKDHLQ